MGWLPGSLRMALRRREARRFYARFVGRGDLCFDIGANEGERTAALLHIGARVVAVEPQAACCERLRARFAGNDRLTVLQCGVGEQSGRAPFFECNETNQCGTFSTEFVEVFSQHSQLTFAPATEMEMVPFDELVGRHGRPRFCKVDTEGYELAVLRGMRQPPEFLAFEFNLPMLGHTLACLDELVRMGPSRCNYVAMNEMRLCLRDWMPLADFRAAFAGMVSPKVVTGEVIVAFQGAAAPLG